MTPCGKGCCFTGLQVCARKRACLCHADERRPPPRGSDSRRHRDPTADQAIRRVMKGKKK